MNFASPLFVLEQGFQWAWQASFAVLPALLVLLALGGWRSLPARIRLLLGIVVIGRLLVPVVPAVPGHPAAWFQEITGAAGRSRLVPADAPEPWSAASGAKTPAPGRGTVGTGPEAFPWGGVLAGIWALGVLGVLVWTAGSHWVLRDLIRKTARPADPQLLAHLKWAQGRMPMTARVHLREVPGLPTVALWGWRRCCILVPDGLAERYTREEIRGMFLHELAHVRRHDVLWTWLGLLAAALHWFNPLLWLALRRLRADREVECDRIALEMMPGEQRVSYGFALLKTLERAVVAMPSAAVPFGQRQPDIQTRIRMIASPFATTWAHRAALAALPLMALAVFTTAQADDVAGKKDQEPGRPVPEAAKEKDVPKPEADAARRDGDLRENRKKEGLGDGEVKRSGPRDGEARRTGPRDGEQVKNGPRDGEARKPGPKEGEAGKAGPRDGDAGKAGSRDREPLKEEIKDGDNPKADAALKEDPKKPDRVVKVVFLALDEAGRVLHQGRPMTDRRFQQVFLAAGGKWYVLRFLHPESGLEEARIEQLRGMCRDADVAAEFAPLSQYAKKED